MAFTDLHEIEDMFSALTGQTAGLARQGSFRVCRDPHRVVHKDRFTRARHCGYMRALRQSEDYRAKERAYRLSDAAKAKKNARQRAERAELKAHDPEGYRALLARDALRKLKAQGRA